ncbi:hypothetical protein HPB48_026911 [Haemaphysalis longicornis]|uniref:Uncharacterized protein n=1 Tax=Haemaphysalis longicornis TaxID=44386 RepID=A0A9J6HD14_HAELO|nr:hypothetical protein HPB48_026911 [Haemaphysalis longicornis]
MSIQKKLRAACNSQSCALIQPWMQCNANHLHFVAAMTKADAELSLCMWKSLLNHICDKHDGRTGPFVEYLHERASWGPRMNDTREKLAALHYNENASRGQAVTQAGDEQFKVKMPKEREGHLSVCQ